MAIAFTKHTRQDLHWYHATDCLHGGIVTDERLLAQLQEMPSSLTGQRLGKILLVVGMPVMITQNFDVKGGIMNGSTGSMSRIRYKLNDQDHQTLISCVVTISDLSEMLMLRPHEIPILEDTN